MIKSTNSILKNRIEKKHNTLAQFSFEYVHLVGKIYLIPYSYLKSLKTIVLECLEVVSKGQIIPKADWRAIDSTKKRMNEFVCFFQTVRKNLKLEVSSSSFEFKFQVFPDCKAKKKQIRLFGFWENLQILRHANLLTVLSDL